MWAEFAGKNGAHISGTECIVGSVNLNLLMPCIASLQPLRERYTKGSICMHEWPNKLREMVCEKILSG